MARESLRAEAARTGASLYEVRKSRLRGADDATFRQRREERHAQQRIRTKRQEEGYSHLPAPAEAGWETAGPGFPLTSEETPHGAQGPFGPSPDPAWDFYWPTRTINPPRPRTLQARYSRNIRELQVIFRDGTPWTYFDVPPNIWQRFKRTESPGRYINAVLNGYDYSRCGWGSIVGED
jgi:hypothetical protein